MDKNRSSARIWRQFYKKNYYYHKDLEFMARVLIPKEASVLEIGSRGGEILRSIPNKQRVGIEWDKNLLALAKQNSKNTSFIALSEMSTRLKGQKFD